MSEVQEPPELADSVAVSDTEPSRLQRGLASSLSDNGFFSTPGIHGLIQQLIYLAQFCDGIAVVQGVSSSGRTTLVAELERQLASRMNAVRLNVKEGDDLEFTVSAIVSRLGLGAGGSIGEQLAELRSFHSALVHEKKAVALLFDDTHFLDDQSLAAIVSLVDGTDVGGSGVHLLFFGASGIANRIDALGLIDAPVYDFDMPLFSRAELEQFLTQSQEDSGLPSSDLTPEKLTQLWSSSQGIPGVALALLKDGAIKDELDIITPKAALSHPAKGRFSSILGVMPLTHAAALLVLLSVLIWAVIGRDHSSGESVVEPIAVAPLSDSYQTNIPQDGKVLRPDEGVHVDGGSDQRLDPLIRAPNIDELAAAADKKLFSAVNPVVRDGDAPKPEKVIEEDDSLNDIESEMSDVLAMQAAKKQSLRLEDPNPEAQIPLDPLAIKPVSEQRFRPTVSKPQVVTEAKPVPVNGESALLSAPSSYYTLQVIAASKDASLRRYIQEQKNSGDLYLYRGLRQGKQWYVVVAGLYPSRELAVKGIQGLPKGQREAGPWPRRIGDIKAEIEANSRF